MLNSRAILLSLTLIVVFGNRHQTNSAYFDSQNPPGRYVYSVAWSPDGSKIAVGRGGFECTGSDNAIHIIEPSTKKTLTILEGHTCEVSSLSWSPDGDHLASASPDGTVRIWDVADGHLIATSDVIDRGRLFVAWSPDGTLIATIALADPGIELLDSSTGQSFGYLCCHPGGAFTATWSPDGSQLASAGRDKNIQLWNVAS